MSSGFETQNQTRRAYAPTLTKKEKAMSQTVRNDPGARTLTVDPGKMLIRSVITTAEADRVGDVVNPTRAEERRGLSAQSGGALGTRPAASATDRGLRMARPAAAPRGGGDALRPGRALRGRRVPPLRARRPARLVDRLRAAPRHAAGERHAASTNGTCSNTRPCRSRRIPAR